jgi:MFS family permease
MRSLQDESQQAKTSTFQAFRPRLLFCPLFAWNAVTGGKFISTLLEYLSPNFSEGIIGLTLSIQYVIVALLAGWGGRLADMEEKQSTFWGWGRLKVMCWGILIGTIAFVGHGLPNLLKFGVMPNQEDDDGAGVAYIHANIMGCGVCFDRARDGWTCLGTSVCN